ncbi:uncharacterized protein LODBEIA_P18060 [Lodderomyces beijingensis]|uniref:Mitochondrial ATPase complex subunit ATP10 n=1 Tax=Lodderomyces beijingensis TaxID=1775926 RepID=A0ABP0ZJG8_9ASCO
MSARASRHFSIAARWLEQRAPPRFVNTFNEATKAAQKKSYAITRPIGLESPILLNHRLSDTYSFSNIRNELFGEQAKERRQRNLNYDLKHSPIYEAKSFEHTKGKIFTPPISWFKQDKSLYFPDFVAKTLTGKQESLYAALSDKYSIVRLFSSITGDNCSRSYFKVNNQDYYTTDYAQFTKQFPHFQIIDINMPTSWIKGFLLNLSISNLKKIIPPQRYDHYFILPGHILAPEVRETLHCDNQCSGYIYILDSTGKIRWASSGYATAEDLQLAWKVVKGLEKEASQAASARV